MNWHLVLAAILAALLPIALIATGIELRRVRLRIVNDLSNTVFAGVRNLPQLRLAEARYGCVTDGDVHAHGLRGAVKVGGRQDEVKQFFGGAVYAFVCLLGFVLLFDPVAYLIGRDGQALKVVDAIFWTPTAQPSALDPPPALRLGVAIAAFAFLGGYVFNLRYLIRQTLNQELSALAFVRAALRLIQGMVLAIVVYHAGATFVPGEMSKAASEAGLGVGLAVAFILGYFPDVGITRMSKWARIHIKDFDERALALAKVIPLEVIDGIDHEISFRLQESNLYDVQNLAVANPIELYVETPYTLVQTFDWVLQAQLCLVVGVDGFFALKRHRVRTIFDLERAVLSKGVPLPYLQGLASVILNDSTAAFRTTIGLPAAYADPAAVTGPDNATIIRHLVAIISDDLHVHRLRALWKAILENTSADDGDRKAVWLFDVGWLPGDVEEMPPTRASLQGAAEGRVPRRRMAPADTVPA